LLKDGHVAQPRSDASNSKRHPVSACEAFDCVLGRRIQQAVLVLVWTGMVGALEVSPDNINWAASIEAASVGTTVVFGPGVYRGQCDVSVPAGLGPTFATAVPRACSRQCISFITVTGAVC
jgi:hypothetical protein